MDDEESEEEHEAEAMDSKFERYVQSQQKVAYELGEQWRAIKNLQSALVERKNLYEADDFKLWRLTETIAQICLNFAVQYLRNLKPDVALDYLVTAKQQTEPLHKSGWSLRQGWQELRRDLNKNMGLYHQAREEWQKAFDCMKQSIQHEKTLKINYANAALTCAVMLSKMGRFAETIDFAQQSCQQIEEQLKMNLQYKALSEYKYTGRNPDRRLELDKHFTTYAIANHLLSKSLMSLKYYREAKFYLNKAQVTVTKCLNEPKKDLQLTIGNDMAILSRVMRTYTNQNTPITPEQIQSTIQSIQSDLATAGHGASAQLDHHIAPASKGDKLEQDHLMTAIQEKEKKSDPKQIELNAKNLQAHEAYLKEKNMTSEEKQLRFAEEAQKKRDETREMDKKLMQAQMKPNVMKDNKAARVKQLARVRAQSDKIKRADLNLASMGARKDKLGIKFSGEKGTEEFITKRRQNVNRMNNIRNVNAGEGYSDSEFGSDDQCIEDFKLPPIKPDKKSVAQKRYEHNQSQQFATVAAKQFKVPKPQSLVKNRWGESGMTREEMEIYMRTQEESKSFYESDQYKSEDEDALAAEIDKKMEKQIAEEKLEGGGRPTKIGLMSGDEESYGGQDGGDQNSIGSPINQLISPQKSGSKDKPPKKASTLAIMRGDAEAEVRRVKLKSSSITNLKGCRTNSTEVKVELGDDIPMRKQATPPTKAERKKMRYKNSFAEEGKKNEEEGLPPSLKSRDLGAKRKSLLYKLKYEQDQKMFKGTDKDKSHNRLDSDWDKVITQQKIIKAVENELGVKRTFDAKRLNNMSRPRDKGLLDEKKRETEERRQVRLAELEEKRNKYKKKDLADFLDRDKDFELKRNGSWNGSNPRSSRNSDQNKQDDLVEKKANYRKQSLGDMLNRDASQKVDDRPAFSVNNNAPIKSEFKKYIPPDKRVVKHIPAKQQALEQVQKENDKNLKAMNTEINKSSDKSVRTPEKKSRLDSLQSVKLKDSPQKYDIDSPVKQSLKKEKSARSVLRRKSTRNDLSLKKQGTSGAKSIFTAGSPIRQGTGIHQTSFSGQSMVDMSQFTAANVLNNPKSMAAQLKNLRDIEYDASVRIQAAVKRFYTRKWYLNYMIRKQLCVPFSGLEFLENPFLRQFNTCNRALQQSSMNVKLGQDEKHDKQKRRMYDIVQDQQTDSAIMLKEVKTGKTIMRKYNKSIAVQELVKPGLQPLNPSIVMAQHASGAGVNINLLPASRRRAAESQLGKPVEVTKGVTPHTLLEQLQNDFVTQGIDAYNQFKSMGGGFGGLGIEHSDITGKPFDAITGEPIIMDGEVDLPKYIGDNPEKMITELNAVQVEELPEYIDNYLKKRHKKRLKKEGRKQKEDAGEHMTQGARQNLLQTDTKKQKLGQNPSDSDESTDSKSSSAGSETDEEKDLQRYDDLMQAKKDPNFIKGTFPIRNYSNYSREPIVFYKQIGSEVMVKWLIYVGVVYIRETDNRIFVPIKILGFPMQARSTIISYTMNVEMMNISLKSTKNYQFETIWPFILYLMNNWVRHQVTLMGIKKVLPGIQKRMPESDFGMHECNEVLAGDIGNLEDSDGAYDNILNFSSEIELDEKFAEDDKIDHPNLLQTLKPGVQGEKVIDKNFHPSRRPPVKEQRIKNKQALVNQYRNSVNDLIRDADVDIKKFEEMKQISYKEQVEINYKPAAAVGLPPEIKTQYVSKFDGKNGGRHVNNRAKRNTNSISNLPQLRGTDALAGGDDNFIDHKAQNQFQKFLSSHELMLPKRSSHHFKLMCALKDSVYFLMEKYGGLSKVLQGQFNQDKEKMNDKNNIAKMATEKRKKKDNLLPPLTIIDYNCLDRAAQKIKMIINCLQIDRRMSGNSLRPRNLKHWRKIRKWHKSREATIEIVNKLMGLGLDLIKIQGEYKQNAKVMNLRISEAIRPDGAACKSINKIQGYQERGQFNSEIEDTSLGASRGITGFTQGAKDASAVDATPTQIRNQNTLDFDDELLQNQTENFILGDKEKSFQRRMNEKSQEELRISDKDKSRFDPFPLDQTSQHSKYEEAINDDEQEQDELQLIIMKQEDLAIQSPGEKFDFADIEKVIPNRTVLEQGCIRFDQHNIEFGGKIFVATLYFRKIKSNYMNMHKLRINRENRYNYDLDDDAAVLGGKRFDINQIMDRQLQLQRFLSRPCAILSNDRELKAKDELRFKTTLTEKYGEKKQYFSSNDLQDIELEMVGKNLTMFKSFAEIKVCSKLSTTIWDDCVNVSWEDMKAFFSFFGIQDWNVLLFLKRGKFTTEEAFIFYHHFSDCLEIDNVEGIQLRFSLSKLNNVTHKYDLVYLNFIEHQKNKFNNQLIFFYEDVLKNTQFNADTFDQLVFPFLTDPNQLKRGLSMLKAKQLTTSVQRAADNFVKRPIYLDTVITQLTKPIIYAQIDKKEIPRNEGKAYQKETFNANDGNEGKPIKLCDQKTLELLMDPSNLFQLDLAKFPTAQSLFLGRIRLKQSRNREASCAALDSDVFNLRIDYFVKGATPVLLLRAKGSLEQVVLDLHVTNQQQIKNIIRICGQTCKEMVYNQLQSLVLIEHSVNGQRMFINFNKLGEKNKNALQDLFIMLQFDEQIVASRIGHNNISKYQSMLKLKNVSKFNRSVLTCVTEFRVAVELLKHHGDLMYRLVYGNGHITPEQMKEVRENLLIKQFNINPRAPLKVHKNITVWKIVIFDTFSCSQYVGLLTREDLEHHYECDQFEFFKNNRNVPVPNLMELLKEYMLQLFTHRTQVGQGLAWNLPRFKKPLNERGIPTEVPADELYKLEQLQVYQHMQTVLEKLRRFERDQSNQLPLSLDKLKKQRGSDKLPMLCLKTKLTIEKVLPIYEVDDMKALKITSAEHKVIVQVTKIFKDLSRVHFALITVTLHEVLEMWIWTIYLPSTQRTFTSQFFASDLFNMDLTVFEEVDKMEGTEDEKAIVLWTKLVNLSLIKVNHMGDMLLVVCDTYKEPLRELLYQTYAFQKQVKDLFFIEVTVKSFSNYVTDAKNSFPSISVHYDGENYYSNKGGRKGDIEQTVALRAFSMTRKTWIKDYQPLTEIIKLLKEENLLLHGDIRNFYFSMIRSAAVLLAHKVAFSGGVQAQPGEPTDQIDRAQIAGQSKQRNQSPPQQDINRATKLTYDMKGILNRKRQQKEYKDEMKNLNKQQQRLELEDQILTGDPLHRLDVPTTKNQNDPFARVVSKVKPDWQNMIELNRVIYESVVALNPIQVCTIAYNEAKDKFTYRLYRAGDSSSLERRFDGQEIQRSCAPFYISMISNNMEKQLGKRIAQYYHANILVASVLQIHDLQRVIKDYPGQSNLELAAAGKQLE